MLKNILENLNEKNNSSASILDYIARKNVPVSPKMIERILGVEEGTYFHMLDLLNVPLLRKLQDKRKTISCFDKWSNDDIFSGADGIELEEPVCAVLSGKKAIHHNSDIWTGFDSQGRRWVSPGNISDERVKRFWVTVGEQIHRRIVNSDWFEMENCEFCEDIPCFINKTIMSNECGYGEDDLKKTKMELIKLYFDVTEEVLNDYRDDLKSLLEYSENDLVDGYNEILGYDFKIIDLIITAENARTAILEYKDFKSYFGKEEWKYLKHNLKDMYDKKSEGFKMVQEIFKSTKGYEDFKIVTSLDEMKEILKGYQN